MVNHSGYPLTFEFTATQAGRHDFAVRARQEAVVRQEAAVMSVEVAGEREGEFDVMDTEPQLYSGSFEVVEPGTLTIELRFTNDWADHDAGLDRNLLVDWLSVTAP